MSAFVAQTYNAKFAKPVLNQIIAIIQRDQQAVIASVNATTYPFLPDVVPIMEFHKGPGERTAFPWLTLSVGDIRFDEEAVGYAALEGHDFSRARFGRVRGRAGAGPGARLRALARHYFDLGDRQ